MPLFGGATDANVQRASKSADTTRNNTASPTADPHLTVPVAASGVYWFEALIYLDSTDATADAQFGLSLPAGASADWNSTFLGATQNLVGTTNGFYSAANVIQTATANTATRTAVRFVGFVTIAATAGNFAMTWAQAAAVASDLTIRKGSMLSVTKVA